MAGDGSSLSRQLRVSRCFCETGRKRYRVPRNVRIPYEILTNIDGDINIGAVEEDAEDQVEEELEEEVVAEDAQEGLEADVTAPDALDTDWEATDDESTGVQQPEAVVLDATDEDSPVESDNEVSDSDDPQPDVGGHPDNSSNPRIPKISTCRLNLTALSQRYNLYFVAYRDEIQISSPQSCVTHSLPSVPDLVLKPGPSAKGRRILGEIDRTHAHQVNHLVIGDFGIEEILLLAYDDGDVIGYYSRHIEEKLIRLGDMPVAANDIHPFFHENVDKSAWGLAIHKKSRLIAVGSNRHEVTIFVPALSGTKARQVSVLSHLYRRLMIGKRGQFTDLLLDFDGGASELLEAQGPDMEALLGQREESWQITLPTGSGGDNIPNLTFSNDGDGNAEKVVAVDVRGNIWLMDIWKATPPVKIPVSHRTTSPWGWGVAVLPESSFLPTDGFEECLGVTQLDARLASGEKTGNWFDISKGIKSEWRSSSLHPWLRSPSSNLGPAAIRHLLELERGATRISEADGRLRGATPVLGIRFSIPNRHDSLDETGEARRQQPKPKPKPILKDGSSILRLFDTDIELRTFEEGGMNVLFENVTRQVLPLPSFRWEFRFLQRRLSNILHIPELSLVIAASMCGRVALITLTRPRKEMHILSTNEIHTLKRGFKVEAILPTRKDEDNNMRPACPLYGVAAAPIPFAGKSNPKVLRRYRLMIQYYDLTVLVYEISRGALTDVLSVV